MRETRKLAAILVADVVGYSRLAGADEDRTLARLRAPRSDLIDPTIALHHGRNVAALRGSVGASRLLNIFSAVQPGCSLRVGTGPSLSVMRPQINKRLVTRNPFHDPSKPNAGRSGQSQRAVC